MGTWGNRNGIYIGLPVPVVVRFRNSRTIMTKEGWLFRFPRSFLMHMLARLGCKDALTVAEITPYPYSGSAV